MGSQSTMARSRKCTWRHLACPQSLCLYKAYTGIKAAPACGSGELYAAAEVAHGLYTAVHQLMWIQ
jgi:hypothetical protein